MVKSIYLSSILFLTVYSYGQNISIGLGANLLLNQLEQSENFKFDVINNTFDTLSLHANEITMKPIYSLPIFIRYSSKKNWWVQLEYGFEYWRIDLDGYTENSPTYLENQTQNALQSSWQNYVGTEYSSLQAYTTAFYPAFYGFEKEKSQTSFQYYDAMQYNKFSLSFGSTLFQKAKYKIVYGLGFDFITKSTSESYHGLVYDNPELNYQFEMLQALPSQVEFNFAPSLKIGLEKQNLRIGIDGHFFWNPIVSFTEESNPSVIYENDVETPTIKSLLSFGFHLNYSLFSHYLQSKHNNERADILDPKILGKHYEKPTKWRLGLTVDFISLVNTVETSSESFNLEPEDHKLIDEALSNSNDDYLTGISISDHEIIDNIYLEKRTDVLKINDLGQVDTNHFSQVLFFNWGELNTIIKSPKISGFARFSPFKSVFFEANVGYQTQTMGVEVYEKEQSEVGTQKTVKIRQLLYQEKFREISVGIQAFATKKVTSSSQIGINFGLLFNHWIPGQFLREKGGINDSELLEEFHDYFILGEGTDEWNNNLNADADKGVFSKQDYYEKAVVSSSPNESYHKDFSSHLLDNFKSRSFFELRFGLDYYIEKWRFSLYAEQSLWQKSIFYNNSFSLGISLSRYL